MFEHAKTMRQPQLRWSLVVLGVFLALAFGSRFGNAQATQGSVVGSVKDPNGAVVPNAAVTLTNTDEGTVRTTKTNSSGDYQFLDVKAGNYQVDILATGFQKWQAVGVALRVRQELRLDGKLAVGEVRQEVRVTGEDVSTIQTESPTISATFTAEDANNLPVNTRASFSGTTPAAIFGTLPPIPTDFRSRVRCLFNSM